MRHVPGGVEQYLALRAASEEAAAGSASGRATGAGSCGAAGSGSGAGGAGTSGSGGSSAGAPALSGAEAHAAQKELGAIEPDERAPGGRRLTRVGRTLARFPLDPRMARMLIEAGRLGALREVLIIVAALSIQDPRERPLGQEQQAREKHKRFEDETSDFLSFLNLWNHLQERRDALSSSAFRREVRAELARQEAAQQQAAAQQQQREDDAGDADDNAEAA